MVIETSRPTEVALLRLAAHGLTAREVDVVELVLRGRSTKQIAAELVMSEYTVQDRLKSVFEKVGVRSRRELVAAVHAADYQPLIDRNDERNRSGLPLQQRVPRAPMTARGRSSSSTPSSGSSTSSASAA